MTDCCGWVWQQNGRTMIQFGKTLGPAPSANAVPYSVGGVDTSWADITLGERYCRVNPELLDMPCYRLGDCLYIAAAHWDAIPRHDGGELHAFGERLLGPPGKQVPYLFLIVKIGTADVCLIDTKARAARHSKAAVSDD